MIMPNKDLNNGFITYRKVPKKVYQSYITNLTNN